MAAFAALGRELAEAREAYAENGRQMKLMGCGESTLPAIRLLQLGEERGWLRRSIVKLEGKLYVLRERQASGAR